MFCKEKTCRRTKKCAGIGPVSILYPWMQLIEASFFMYQYQIIAKPVVENIFQGHIQIMYHRQKNKFYPQSCLLAHFEATLDLTVANLLAHNNLCQICYCGQIYLQSFGV